MDLRSLRYFVAVAEERHFGRAAARLHMTQPPLSRAIKQLETDVGALLVHRSPAGATLTPAGTALYDEARALLEHAEHARARVAAAAGTATFTIGTLADSADEAGTGLADAFRQRNPGVRVRVREGDLTDPTAGLRAGRVDVVLTRMPFDRTGISIRVLRSDPVGVVLRADDPLARRGTLQVSDLDDRRWFQFPEGTDPLWRAYWNCTTPDGALRDGPVVRTVSECVQAVFWSGAIGLAPLAPLPHAFPQGLTVVPLADMAPSRLVVAWNKADANPLIRSLIQIAATVYRSRPVGLRVSRRPGRHDGGSVDDLHGERGMGVAQVAGEKYHQRGEGVVVETVLPGQVKVGAEAVTGDPLGHERGDDGDAAVPAAQRRVRPGGPACCLELLLGEDRPDPGRERGGQLVLRHSEDARVGGDAACAPDVRRGVGAGAHQAACSQ
jgi:DNA-binding transcriptional LysR family regulator